jgi:hypothetical protein
MAKKEAQDKYKYRPKNWRRFSRIAVARFELTLKSLEDQGKIKYVGGRWYAIEHAPSLWRPS